MVEGKPSKIRDLKETVSGVVEIVNQIRNPSIKESMDRIASTTQMAKGIIEILKTPEMVKNIENFRIISENMNETTTRLQNSIKQLEESGVIRETTELMKSAKKAFDSFGEGELNGQNLREMSVSIKEMFKSIRSLVDEIRITIAYSKKSNTIREIGEAVRQTSDIYKTTLGYSNIQKK